MRKLLFVALAAAVGAALPAAGAAGSSESSAIFIKIGDKKDVTLVEETGAWSSGGGVCYLKMTLRKNHAYTVWFEGADADQIGVDGLDVYAEENWGDWGDDDWGSFDDDFGDWGSDDDWGDWGGGSTVNDMPWATFDMAEEQYGNYVSWLRSDSWDVDDPSSWTYYICISGEIGLGTTVHVAEGIQTFLPDGLEANPRKIVFKSQEQTYEGATTEESAYYFTAPLEAGHKYVVRTTGGTAANPLSVDAFASMDYSREKLVTDPYNEALAIYPEAGGNFQLAVFANATNAPFGFAWQDELGTLVVELRGAPDATWTVDKDKTKHVSGESIAIVGEHVITFSKQSGFSTPAAQTVTVRPGKDQRTVVVGTYNDTYDPKDDASAGATKLKVAAKEASAPRTLWGKGADGAVADPADWFSFTAKDGTYFNFKLAELTGDAVLTVMDKYQRPVGSAGVTAVNRLALEAGDYFVCVEHGTANAADSTYTLVSSCASVGSIKFAKAAVDVKKSAGVVTLDVNRTAKEGKVRVRYATVDGTALAGAHYEAVQGELVWENGDKAKKTISVKVIPDLVSVYDPYELDRQFQVKLEPVPEQELEDGEYPAQILADTCTVTVTPSAKKGDTIEKAYAKATPKQATTKTEQVRLRSGTFAGVLAALDPDHVPGNSQLASLSLTVTVKDGKADKLSATVQHAGKKYSFKGDAVWATTEDGRLATVLSSGAAKLELTLADGETAEAGAWLKAGGTAVFSASDDLGAARCAGEFSRDNTKVQGYLDAVLPFAGYYTVALVPDGVSAMDGIPAGNGYLTVTVDNKGTAKVAGLLADGTKVSLSVKAAAVREDAASKTGYAMYLSIYQAKGTYCFGGTLRLFAQDGATLPNRDYEIVADSASALTWNNDDARLTYDGEEGWCIACQPTGGWYDTVYNLQAHYLGLGFEAGVADAMDFAEEALPDGYWYASDPQPNGQAIDLTGNAFSIPKKGALNPCDVQIKFTRATGVYSGKFSLMMEDGFSTKELKGLTHNGVVLLTRDSAAPLFDDQVGAGFCTQKGVKLDDGRSWSCSLPFNLVTTLK